MDPTWWNHQKTSEEFAEDLRREEGRRRAWMEDATIHALSVTTSAEDAVLRAAAAWVALQKFLNGE